jgi:hypothetical protein
VPGASRSGPPSNARLSRTLGSLIGKFESSQVVDYVTAIIWRVVVGVGMANARNNIANSFLEDWKGRPVLEGADVSV